MFDALKKIWVIFTPGEKRKLAWILLLIVLMALMDAVGVLSLMPFLSVLGRPDVVHENQHLESIYATLGFASERTFILSLGLLSIGLVVFSSAFKTGTLHIVNRFVHLERHSLSSRLLSKYLCQPYEYFLGKNASALSKNVLSEVDQLVFELIQPLSQLIAQGAVVITMGVLFFVYDPLIAACIIAALAALYGSIYVLVRNRMSRIGRERHEANARRHKTASEALSGIKDVKITHSAGAYQTQFDKASRLFSRHSATTETLSQSPLYLVEATGYCVLIFVALLLLLRSNDIAQVLPALGLYGFAAYRMLPAAQVMYRGFAKLRISSAALNDIHRDLALPDEVVGDHASILAARKEIRMEGICYAYPSAQDKPILSDFDLVIPANTSIGIAGRSGAGKSTLIDILLGLLQPQAGVLSIDGAPITAKNVSSWQRGLGYVPQQIFLADASVAENIAFGVPAEKVDKAAMERAARAAQIHDFIVALPDGYETMVGDRGMRLSGGQRQRVGIARALYRDPPVLLMDEATSALDPETESAVNSAIRGLSGKKTIIVVAHKGSSLRDCDQIVHIGFA